MVVWHDRRRAPLAGPPYYNPNYDLFAQRLDANGVVQWNPEGLPICVSGGERYLDENSLAPDGSGGVFVHFRGSGHFIQRMTGAGLRLWGSDGVSVPGDIELANVTGDGDGGAFVAWTGGSDGHRDVFLHHFGSQGQLTSPQAGRRPS